MATTQTQGDRMGSPVTAVQVRWMTCPRCGASSADIDTVVRTTRGWAHHECPVCAGTWAVRRPSPYARQPRANGGPQ